jgi:hypothetical protein
MLGARRTSEVGRGALRIRPRLPPKASRGHNFNGGVGLTVTALNILGATARNARMTARQLSDFGDRLTCKEIQDLRAEAASLDLTLPRYLCEVIRRRRADLIRLSVQAEQTVAAEKARRGRGVKRMLQL